MRISRNTLTRNWLWSVLAAIAVGAVLGGLDARLKALTGAGTGDLQGFATAAQFEAAFHAWGVHAYLARAGFNLGLDYLFMPLYAAAFFYSGILAREAFAPRPGRLRRILTLLSAVPIAGAVLDALENALQLSMMLNGATDSLNRVAFTVSNAKWMAIYVGLALLLGAVMGRAQERAQKRLRQA